ncbi:MAG: transposase [Pirellulales bacterium]|nr:transposase [Pirellulales bacterium]
MPSESHRKRVKHYHDAGDVHELTCSCYRRLPLLTNNLWRGYLARALDTAAQAAQIQLYAFVFMREHLHLLVNPVGINKKESLSHYLAAFKRKCSVQVKEDCERGNNALLAKLTIQERPGRIVFRFWQEGGGYDRNLKTAATIQAAIDYLHLNPVRAGLCKLPTDWKWSSARWFASEAQTDDPDLPRLWKLPAEYARA